jgi:hypothetical protein
MCSYSTYDTWGALSACMSVRVSAGTTVGPCSLMAFRGLTIVDIRCWAITYYQLQGCADVPVDTVFQLEYGAPSPGKMTPGTPNTKWGLERFAM